MPLVADYIEQNKDHLVQAFAEEVGKLPAAQGLSYYETVDTLYEYLESLARISRAGRRQAKINTAQRLEETHIGLRLRIGYRQEEATGEYALIGRLLAQLWDGKPAAEQPEPDDIRLLGEELQAAMETAVAVFSGYSAEERQAEKRYLRRLDTLSLDLLGGATSNVLLASHYVQPLLEVVLEAMDADGGAIFLADDAGQQLLPAALVGVTGEPAAIPLSKSSFLARVASSDEPVYLVDARRADGSLGGSGLRSLLGLRLQPGSVLLGVIYLGMRQVRLFEPRQKRYFEMLADALSRIIERITLVEASRQAQQRMQLVLDSTAEGIYGIDRDGRCTFANRACLRLLGYGRAEDLLGQPMHALIHHTRPDGTPFPAEECPLMAVVSGSNVVELDGDLIWRADGSSFYADQRAAQVQQDGQAIAAVVSFSDVTSRLKTAAEREVLLANAQRAVSAREEIVRIVSHDLRSPVSSILMAAALVLRDVALDSRGRRISRNAGLIQYSATRMHRLIDDLTDFGGIEAGVLALKLARSDASAIAREAADSFRDMAQENGLTFRESVPDRLPAIRCDRHRLLQVLENLLANAVKATCEGGEVRLVAEAQPDAVCFSVADTGPGLVADELPHLFDRYWRSRQAGYGGTGLGLAIAKGIVEAHGGRIWAESVLGQGSVFRFTIPLAVD